MDKVQHFEVPVDDIARAKKFYTGVFGWGAMDFPMPGMQYVGLHTGPVDEKNMWKEPGFINGGMFQRNPKFPLKGPTIAITVDDIDASIKKVKAAGGEVMMEKMQIADMGLYAYIKDTEGNVIGIWQNLTPGH